MSLYSTTLQQLGINECTFQQKGKGRVYKRSSISRQLFKAHDDGYHPRVARQLVTTLRRYINTRPKHERKTSAFVAEIRRKILCLHEYNVQIAKVKFKYPRSEQLDLLLIQYVELECGLLYDTYEEVDKVHEDNVTQRVLRLLRLILHDALQNGEVSLKATSEACDKILLKLFAKVRIDCISENKLLSSAVTKLLSSLNLLEEVNKLKGKHIPFYQDTLLKDPLVSTIRQTLETSDYYSDDDSDDEIEIVSGFDNLFSSTSKPPTLSNIIEERTYNQSSKNFDFTLHETPNYYQKSSAFSNIYKTRGKFDTIGQNKENSNSNIHNSRSLKSCVNEESSNLKKNQDDVTDSTQSNNADRKKTKTFFNRDIDVQMELEKSLLFNNSTSVTKKFLKLEDRDGQARKPNFINELNHKENWKQEKNFFLLQEITDLGDPSREREASSKIVKDLASLNDDNQQKVGSVLNEIGSSQDTAMHKTSTIGHLKNPVPVNLSQTLTSQIGEKSPDLCILEEGAISIDALPDSTNSTKTPNVNLNDNIVTIEIDDDDDDNFVTNYNGLSTVNSNLLPLNEIKLEENEENQSPNFPASHSDNKQNFSGSDKSSKNSDSTTFNKMDNSNGDFTQDTDICEIIISDSEDEVCDMLEGGIESCAKETRLQGNVEVQREKDQDDADDTIPQFQSEQVSNDTNIVNVEKRTDLKVGVEIVQDVECHITNTRSTDFSNEGKDLACRVDEQKHNDEILQANRYNTEDVCHEEQTNSSVSKNCIDLQKEFVTADAENDDNNEHPQLDGVTIEANKNLVIIGNESTRIEDIDNTLATEYNDSHEDTLSSEHTENQRIELNSNSNTCEDETNKSETECFSCVTNSVEMWEPRDSTTPQENSKEYYSFTEACIETSECRNNFNTEEEKIIQGAEREENENILQVNQETEDTSFNTVNNSVSTKICPQLENVDVNVTEDQEPQINNSLGELNIVHFEENRNEIQKTENAGKEEAQFVDLLISDQHTTDTDKNMPGLQDFEEPDVELNNPKNDECVVLHGFEEVPTVLSEQENDVVVTGTTDSVVTFHNADVVPPLSVENRDDQNFVVETIDASVLVETNVDAVIEPVDFRTTSKNELQNVVKQETQAVMADVANSVQFEFIPDIDEQPSNEINSLTDVASEIVENSIASEHYKNYKSDVVTEEQVVFDSFSNIQDEASLSSDHSTITVDEGLDKNKNLELSCPNERSGTMQSTEDLSTTFESQVSVSISSRPFEAHEQSTSEETTNIESFEESCVDSNVENAAQIPRAEVHDDDVAAVISGCISQVESEEVCQDLSHHFSRVIITENNEQCLTDANIEGTVLMEAQFDNPEQAKDTSDSENTVQNEITCEIHHDLLHQTENLDHISNIENITAVASTREVLVSFATSNLPNDIQNEVISESGELNEIRAEKATKVEEISHLCTKESIKKIQPVVLTDQLSNLEQVEVISDSIRGNENEEHKQLSDQLTDIGGEVETEGEHFYQPSVQESVETSPSVDEKQFDNVETQVIFNSAKDAPCEMSEEASKVETYDMVHELHEQLSSVQTEEVTANLDSSFDGQKLESIPSINAVEVDATNLELVSDAISNVRNENDIEENEQMKDVDEAAKEDHHTIPTDAHLNILEHVDVISACAGNAQSEIERPDDQLLDELNPAQLTEIVQAKKLDASSLDNNDDTTQLIVSTENDQITEEKSNKLSKNGDLPESKEFVDEKTESDDKMNQVWQSSENSVVCQISLQNTHIALEKIAEDVIRRKAQSSEDLHSMSEKDLRSNEYGPKLSQFTEACPKTIQQTVMNEKEAPNLIDPDISKPVIEQAEPKNANIQSSLIYTLPSTVNQVQYNEYNSEKKVSGDLELLANIAADQATLAVKPESEKETLRRGRSKMKLDLSQQSRISRSEDSKYKPHDFISMENSTLPAITNNVYAQKRFMETNTTSEDSNDSCESTLFIDLGENMKNSEKPSKSIYEEETICDLLELITTEDKEGVCLSIPDTEGPMSNSFYILKQELEISVGNADQTNTQIENLEETDVSEKQQKLKTTKTTDHSIDNILNKSPTVETKVSVQDFSNDSDFNKSNLTELIDASKEPPTRQHDLEIEIPNLVQLDEIHKINEQKNQVETIQDDNTKESNIAASELGAVPTDRDTGSGIVTTLLNSETVEEPVQDLSILPEDLTVDKAETTIEKLDEHNETTFKTKAAVKAYEDKLHPNPYVLLHQFDTASMLSKNGPGVQTRSRSKRSETTPKQLIPLEGKRSTSVERDPLSTTTIASQESCTPEVEDIVTLHPRSLEKNDEKIGDEAFEISEIVSNDQKTENKLNEDKVETANSSFTAANDDNIESTNEPIKVVSMQEIPEKNTMSAKESINVHSMQEIPEKNDMSANESIKVHSTQEIPEKNDMNLECESLPAEIKVLSCEQLENPSNEQDATVENKTKEIITSSPEIQSHSGTENLSQESLTLMDIPIKGFNAKKHSDKINLDKTTKLSKTPDEAKGRSLENTIKKMKERVREKLFSGPLPKEIPCETSVEKRTLQQVNDSDVSKDNSNAENEHQRQPTFEELNQRSVEIPKKRESRHRRRRSRSSSKSRLSDKKSQEIIEKEKAINKSKFNLKSLENIDIEKSNCKSSPIRISQEDTEKEKFIHKSIPNRRSQDRTELKKSVGESSLHIKSQEHVEKERSTYKSSPNRKSQDHSEQEKSVSKSSSYAKSQEHVEKERSICKSSPNRKSQDRSEQEKSVSKSSSHAKSQEHVEKERSFSKCSPSRKSQERAEKEKLSSKSSPSRKSQERGEKEKSVDRNSPIRKSQERAEKEKYVSKCTIKSQGDTEKNVKKDSLGRSSSKSHSGDKYGKHHGESQNDHKRRSKSRSLDKDKATHSHDETIVVDSKKHSRSTSKNSDGKSKHTSSEKTSSKHKHPESKDKLNIDDKEDNSKKRRSKSPAKSKRHDSKEKERSHSEKKRSGDKTKVEESKIKTETKGKLKKDDSDSQTDKEKLVHSVSHKNDKKDENVLRSENKSSKSKSKKHVTSEDLKKTEEGQVHTDDKQETHRSKSRSLNKKSNKLDEKDKHRESHKTKLKEKENHFKSLQNNSKNDSQKKTENSKSDKSRRSRSKEKIKSDSSSRGEKLDKDNNKDDSKQVLVPIGEPKEYSSKEIDEEKEKNNTKHGESNEKSFQLAPEFVSDIENKDSDTKVNVETEPKSSSPSEQLPDVCIETSKIKNKEVRKIDIPKKRKYDMREENSDELLKAKVQKMDTGSETNDDDRSSVKQNVIESNMSEYTIPPQASEELDNVNSNVSVITPILEDKTKVTQIETDISHEELTAMDLTYEAFSSGIKINSCKSDEVPNPTPTEEVTTPTTDENSVNAETPLQSSEIKNSSKILPPSEVEEIELQTDVKRTVLLNESIPISSSEPVYIDAVFSSSSTDINVQVLSSSVDSTVKHLVGHEPDLSLIPTVSSVASDQFSFTKNTGPSNGENLNTSDIFHTSLSLGDISPTKLPLAANQSLDFNLPPTSISEINNSMNLVQTLGSSTINFEVSTTSEIDIQQTSKPNTYGDNIVRTEIRCFMEKEAPADHNYTLSDPLVGGNNEDKNILTTGLSLTNSPGEFQLNESHLEDLSFNENNFIEENGTLEDLALLLPCKKEKPDFDNIIDEAIPKPEDIQNSIKRLNMLVDISQNGQPKTVPLDNAIDQSSNTDRNVGLGIDYAVSELLFLGGGEVTTQNNAFAGIPDIDNINIIETNDSSVHRPKQSLEEPVIETPPPSNECSTLTDCNSFPNTILADTNRKVVVEPVEQCPITSFEQLKKDYITDTLKSVEKTKPSKPKNHPYRTTNFATFLESVKRDANKNENKAKDEIENYMVRRHNRTPVVPSKKKNMNQQQTPSPPQLKKGDNLLDTNKTLNIPGSGRECRIRVKTDLVNAHDPKNLSSSDSLEYINEHDQNIASEVVLPFSKPSPSELKLEVTEKKETATKLEIKHSRFDKMGNDYIMENILNVYNSDSKPNKSPADEKTVKKIEANVGKKRKSTDNEVRHDEKRQKKSDDELEINHTSSEPSKSDSKVPINKPSNDEIFDKLVEEGPVNKIFVQKKMSEQNVVKKELIIKTESKNVGYFTQSPDVTKKESGTNPETQRSRGYFTTDPPNTARKESGQMKVSSNALKSRGGYLTVPDSHRKDKSTPQPSSSQLHNAQRHKESQRYPYPNRREQKKFGYFTSDHIPEGKHAEKGHIPVSAVETSSKRPMRNSGSSYNSKSDPCTTRDYKTRDRRLSSEHPNSIYPNPAKPETSNQQDEDKFSWIDRFSGTGLFDTPSGLFTSPGGKR